MDRRTRLIPEEPGPTLAQDLAMGAAAGAAATLVMSLVMLPAKWLGLLGTQPPRKIADRLVEGFGGGWGTPEAVRRMATTLVHLGTGTACGAAFGLGRSVTGGAGSPAIVGPAFGAGVWSVAYLVAAPSMELLPPPWKDRPVRPHVMFIAHLVYGIVTSILFDTAVRLRSATRGQASRPCHSLTKWSCSPGEGRPAVLVGARSTG